MPIYAIVIIVLGIVILALILLYIVTTTGKGSQISSTFFNWSGNVSGNASEIAKDFGGK